MSSSGMKLQLGFYKSNKRRDPSKLLMKYVKTDSTKTYATPGKTQLVFFAHQIAYTSAYDAPLSQQTWLKRMIENISVLK